jgi:hypothetical protein
MTRTLPIVLLTSCALAACGQKSDSGAEHYASMEVAEAASDAAEAMSEPAPAMTTRSATGDGSNAVPSDAIPVSQPQVAYSYAFGFRLPADAIRPLQERHADMCEAKGPNVCRLISMDQAENEGDYAHGTLTLAVRSQDARAFGKELATASGKLDGELVSSSIEGEDLSKNIVDTEARLRARTVLRDRLMEVLRSRKGTVAELVEAERGVAQVNEEIDQAKGWLTEMRGRVAYSQVTVSYESGTPSGGGFIDPIRNTFNSLGSILGNLIAALIVLLTLLVPVGAIVWLAIWLWRRLGFSTRVDRSIAATEDASEPPAD